MKTLIILILSVSLVGCRDTSTSHEPLPYITGDTVWPRSPIRYFKDERSGICFAERGVEKGVGNLYSFTEVPCEKITFYKSIIPTPIPQKDERDKS